MTLHEFGFLVASINQRFQALTVWPVSCLWSTSISFALMLHHSRLRVTSNWFFNGVFYIVTSLLKEFKLKFRKVFKAENCSTFSWYSFGLFSLCLRHMLVTEVKQKLILRLQSFWSCSERSLRKPRVVACNKPSASMLVRGSCDSWPSSEVGQSVPFQVSMFSCLRSS